MENVKKMLLNQACRKLFLYGFHMFLYVFHMFLYVFHMFLYVFYMILYGFYMILYCFYMIFGGGTAIWNIQMHGFPRGQNIQIQKNGSSENLGQTFKNQIKTI